MGRAVQPPGNTVVLAARHLVWFGMGAVNGGPSLVSGCCGSHLAADRPTSGRFSARLVVSGGGALPGGGGSRPARDRYAAASSSTGLALSRINCSTTLAVYLLWTTGLRQQIPVILCRTSQGLSDSRVLGTGGWPRPRRTWPEDEGGYGQLRFMGCAVRGGRRRQALIPSRPGDGSGCVPKARDGAIRAAVDRSMPTARWGAMN